MAVNLVAGSNDVGTAKTVKTDRSRRTWSVREEEILLATMKELAANGWRGDNGYRAGYLTRIREAIKLEFPDTDILTHPHIYSKITTWKKNYGSLMMMLNHSGIGFNSDGKYKIECDDEQWAQFVKKDSNAKYMRNKSWSLIEDWKEIFGKDRADGANKVHVSEAVGRIYGTKEYPADDAGISQHMTLQDLFPDESFPDGVLPEMVDESQSYTEGGGAGAGAGDVFGAGGVSGSEAGTGTVGGSGSGAGCGDGDGAGAGAGAETGARARARSGPNVANKVVKKRKLDDKMDGVLHLMSQIHTDTNDRLKEISARIGYEFDLSTKRSEVFDQLKGIPGLTLKQQFYVSKKLVKEPELMDLFRGLAEVARAAFVFDLLEEDEMI
ncbi:hypothetical protein SASPL_108355 [Salvia splendens]|uniref:Myb/SANT-like domain-containing protein n=1 Tax=Salvia splendens TaxID=180675 RepID=A0A8X8YI39_SALSN|nr:hypothetical protein SASPL_108355 [Salvia splendens]